MYITIVVKQVYWYISQVSCERLQDHWSSGVCILYCLMLVSCIATCWNLVICWNLVLPHVGILYRNILVSCILTTNQGIGKKHYVTCIYTRHRSNAPYYQPRYRKGTLICVHTVHQCILFVYNSTQISRGM